MTRLAAVLAVVLSCVAPATAESWPAAADPYRDLWRMEWQRCGLRDEYRLWMLGQVWQESRFRADAVSPVGAVGLTQVMPGTDALLRRAYRDYAALEGGPDEPTVALRALCHLTLEGLRAARGAPDRKTRWRYSAAIYNGGYWVLAERRAAAEAGDPPWDWGATFEQCGRVLLRGRGPRSEASCRENQEYPALAFRWAPLFEGY